jgi:hypothetical protein
MSSPLPTKMSLFENITSLSTASYIIGLDVYAGQLANIKISGSAAGYELSRKRWIINPPVTSSTDPRGADGAESYSGDGKYWIKSGSVWTEMLGSGSYGTGGIAGTSGTSGINGTSGSSGSSGQSGSSGTSGVSGSSGTSGSSGSSGTSGSSGSSGSSGQSGSSGTSGQSGPTTGTIYSRLIKNVSGTITNFSSDTEWAQSEVFNVKDFGAVGDDSTNDTSAILSAINSAQSSGKGTVYFPDGIYRITGSLQLPNNPQCDIALVGNGSNVSVIKQTANVNGIEFNMDNGALNDQIYQVSIKGLGLTTSGTSSSSIYITYGTSSQSAHENISVDLHDVHILSDNTNYWSNGIVLESAWNFRITNCMIVGRPLGSFYQGTGLELRRLCVNGTINQSQFNFWNTGIFVNSVDYTSTGQNTEGLLLNQIYMVPVVYGIYAKGNKSFFTSPFNSYDWANRPIAGRIVLLTLNNSHIDSRNSGSALWLENVQGHYISNNFLISDNTGSVIRGVNAHEGTFIGNTLFNAGSAPSVYIGGYSGSANIIAGNVFRGGSTQVLLESSSIYNKVYGNVVNDALTISLSNLGTDNLTGSVGY